MTLVTEQNVGAVLERLAKPKRLITDTETTGLFVWKGARQIGISVTYPGAGRQHCYYFPFRHEVGKNLSKQRLRQLMFILAKVPVLTGWNLNKFDMHMLGEDGMPDRGNCEDIMLLFHLIDENQWKTGGSYELKITAERYIDKNARLAELALMNLLADRGLTKGDMAKLTPEEVDPYASDDVYYTERIREMLVPAAKEWEVEHIWHEVNDYALVTRKFESRGLMLDVPLIEQYQAEANLNADKLRRRINRLAGHQINLRSNPQLRNWLGLPSTAKDYIEEIGWTLTGEQRKAVDTLQVFRQWDKVNTAYYNKFLNLMDENGVFHPGIKLHGTVSGRPSAEDSIQAIPRYTPIYKVKDVFQARPGYTYLSVDYGQMELRLGAHYSEDEFLIKCFQEGRSPHKLMQADLIAAGVDIDYDGTKRVNFAVMYGTGAPTLSKELRKDERFARKILKIAHELHPNYRPMLAQCEQTARQFGYIRLWTGRVRHFNTLRDPQPWYRKAASNLIQGGVAEVMRHAITRLASTLDGHDVHMLLQVHDQILFEVPTRAVKHYALIIARDMTRDFPFSVPFVVDIKAGKRWGKLEDYKWAA